MMNDNLRLLKLTLQMLALPVTGQVRLVADDCARVEVLAEAFSTTHQFIHTAAGPKLTPQQVRALARLDDQLVRVRRESCLPLSSELAMRTSSEWRQVRTRAREALIHFRWTLEFPPQRSIAGEEYVTQLQQDDAHPGSEFAATYTNS